MQNLDTFTKSTTDGFCGFSKLKVYSDLIIIDCNRLLIWVSLMSCSLAFTMRPPAGGVCARSTLILVQVLVLVHCAAGYNLDQEHSMEFSGPSSSMFGYSVLLHRHGSHNWSGSILFVCYWSMIYFLFDWSLLILCSASVNLLFSFQWSPLSLVLILNWSDLDYLLIYY